MIPRILNLPKSHSFFLFGPRQTGKTSLIKASFEPNKILHINLLLGSEYGKYIVDTGKFRNEVLGLSNDITHVFVDEVQRIPSILDEVQTLLDDKIKQKFILSGSSARKLKRSNSNMLGGRALNYRLFPFTQKELGSEFCLNDTISYGSLPPVFIEKDPEFKKQILKSYIDVYLDQEIKAEALSRNIGGFLRFLKVAAQMNTEQLNFSSIAKDVGLSSVTVKEYYQILEDTLIGNFLYSFSKSERKSLKISPKFYFFDIGIVRALQDQLSIDPQLTPFEYGKHFENWFINEVLALSKYMNKDWRLYFLRTRNDVEVDLIIETPRGKIIAIEIKSKKWPESKDYMKGFTAIRKFSKNAELICVCNGDRARHDDGIEILPALEALEKLRSE